jgi:ammonia channel protein AmtB
LQWFFWGYSLAFSDGANAYIGNLKYFALKGVEGQPSIGSARIPALVFCIYQLMFAAITWVFLRIRLGYTSNVVVSQPGHRHWCCC